jgi:hypothetical protein
MKLLATHIALAMGLAASTPAHAAGEIAMKFKTTHIVATSVHSDLCTRKEHGDHEYQVTVLRNAQGEIGGYMAQLLILDSGIDFLDCDGKLLTSFHIFAPDAEKAAASRIIAELTAQFPVREVLECPKKN